jgi:hypothetical protein
MSCDMEKGNININDYHWSNLCDDHIYNTNHKIINFCFNCVNERSFVMIKDFMDHNNMTPSWICNNCHNQNNNN